MNKKELVEKVSESCGTSQKETQNILNGFLQCIEDALGEGQEVQLVGFGTFLVRERKERMGHNPKNPGQVIKIEASKTPAFKAGKTLKEAVNQK